MNLPGADHDNNSNSSNDDNQWEEDTSNMLFAIILHRQMVLANHRRRPSPHSRNESNSTTSVSSCKSPTRPLIVLTEDEARSRGALCRFCFEGVDEEHEEQEEETTKQLTTTSASKSRTFPMDRRLVAACACTGSSEYVHVTCLRKWQRHATTSDICRVCATMYSLPPLPPRQVRPLEGGTLLVSRHLEGGIFGSSVVLLLTGTNQEGELPFGVILNKPLPKPMVFPLSTKSSVPQFLGGPVSGGRLGVTRYMILQPVVIQGPNNSNDNNDNSNDSKNKGRGSHHHSHPELRGNRRWALSDPILCNEQYEICLLHDMKQTHKRDLSALLEASAVADFLAALPQPSSHPAPLVFAGYCQWDKGQLEREVEQGDIWDLATGRVQDVGAWSLPSMDSNNDDNNSNNNNLWHALQPGRAGHERLWHEDCLYVDDGEDPVVTAAAKTIAGTREG